MAQPEKEPENRPNLGKDAPKLDAIFPDNLPPAAAELVGDIDNYQKKLESEWKSAKVHYEDKINRIMEEFMNARSSTIKDIPQKPRSHEELFPRFNFEPERTPLAWNKARNFPWKKWVPWAAAVVVLSGLGFFYNALAIQVDTLPYTHTLGPVVWKENIYIADWFRKTLFVHRNAKGLPIVSVEPLPGSLATGIAISDKTIWTLDGLDLKINLHATTADHQVTESVDTQGQKPAGLFYDGLDLWSADQDARRLYRHRGNDIEEIRDTFPLPEIMATAFGFFNNRLWVLDGKARLVNVYRLQKPLLELGSFDLDPFLNGATPTGFTIVGRKMWIVTENPVSLVRVPLSRLKKSKTETF